MIGSRADSASMNLTLYFPLEFICLRAVEACDIESRLLYVTSTRRNVNSSHCHPGFFSLSVDTDSPDVPSLPPLDAIPSRERENVDGHATSLIKRKRVASFQRGRVRSTSSRARASDKARGTDKAQRYGLQEPAGETFSRISLPPPSV